jgi:DnaK suppressor protein
MTPERLNHFRERLQLLEREIQSDLDASKEASGVVELDTSIGRLSRMDAMQNQQMALELRRRQEQQLQRIDNALKRIDQNRYGLCGRCKQPIAEERLEISPDVVMCVRCA